MSDSFLIGITSIFALGIGAQWLAYRLKLPSILLLLVFGFLAGPITGLLRPELLQGDWVFPFVALSVGIILFEGGLSLRLSEYREVGAAVRNLITVGVAVTWVLAAAGAYFLAGFSASMAIIIGAILVVTGPTVVLPLLRHVRPKGRIGTVAKWEGITIDPVGAILAVLVLEFFLLINEPGVDGSDGLQAAFLHALEGLFLEIAVGTGMAVIGAGVLLFLLRRRLVPDYLQNPLALMVVVITFTLSDVLKHESGLLATTLMGLIVANQKYVSVRRLVAFKEDLRVLLIGTLFIVLSARLDVSALAYFTEPGYLLFLGALIFVVRPVAVMCSALGTNLSFREQAFLAWLAPRGIVAAAVASLFSFRLQEVFPEAAAALVPLIFMVIVGTVAVYGLTIVPVARWLGLAQPDPQGLLFVGAHRWARALAAAVEAQGFRVLLLDVNPDNVAQAEAEGLSAQRANALSEHVVENLDLNGIGRLLAVTPNDEVNALAALHFYELFDSMEIYQIGVRSREQRDEAGDLPMHLRGRPLFRPDATFASISACFDAGARIEVVPLEGPESYSAFLAGHDRNDILPLFLVRGSQLQVYTTEGKLAAPEVGDRLIVLLSPEAAAEEALEGVTAEEGANGAPEGR